MSDRVHIQVQGDRELQPALEDLWRSLGDIAWPGPDGCIVIQVGATGRTPLTVETARSLARWLAARRPGCRIEISDVLSDPNAWPGLTPARWIGGDTVSVAGLGALRSVNVPADWFEPFFLVTIAGAGPAAATRISGVLGAQAEVLVALNPGQPRGPLRCEAHRLAASDLAIACGSTGAAERAWWIAGGDVAVERAVGASCGLRPAELPTLRQLAEHQVVPVAGEVASSNTLGVRPAPGWQAALASAGDTWTATWATLRYDVPAVRRNITRVPAFVRRYAAQLGIIRG